MGWIVILLVIAAPIVEIVTFIKVAGAIGFLETVAIAVIAGIAGLWLLRAEGLATLMRARDAMQKGEAPVAEMIDGMVLAVAGLLLFLPGLISDVLALFLLLPPVRALLRRTLARKVRAQTAQTGVIEGEYVVIDEPGDDKDPPPDRRLR